MAMVPVGGVRYHTFIPYNLRIPPRCAFAPGWVERHIDRIDSVGIDMNFTYSPARTADCVHGLAPGRNFRLDFGLGRTRPVAQVRLHGGRGPRLRFLRALLDRRASGRCIEYACVYIEPRPGRVLFEDLDGNSNKLSNFIDGVGQSAGLVTDTAATAPAIGRAIQKFRSGATSTPVCPTYFESNAARSIGFIVANVQYTVVSGEDISHIEKCAQKQLSCAGLQIVSHLNSNTIAIISVCHTASHLTANLRKCKLVVKSICYSDIYKNSGLNLWLFTLVAVIALAVIALVSLGAHYYRHNSRNTDPVPMYGDILNAPPHRNAIAYNMHHRARIR